MEIRFDLPHGPEKSDWKAFYHVYYRLNPTVRFLSLLFRLVCGVLCFLMAFMVVGILLSEDSSPVNAVIPAVLCLLLALYAVRFQLLAVWWSKRNMVSPNERMTVTVNEAGITDQTGAITTNYEYQAFYAICYYRDIYMLFLSQKTALLLPERFREGAGSAEFKRFLEEKTEKTVQYIK